MKPENSRDKKKILKATSGKKQKQKTQDKKPQITYEGKKIRMISDFSSAILDPWKKCVIYSESRWEFCGQKEMDTDRTFICTCGLWEEVFHPAGYKSRPQLRQKTRVSLSLGIGVQLTSKKEKWKWSMSRGKWLVRSILAKLIMYSTSSYNFPQLCI